MTQEMTLTLDDNLIHRAESFAAKQSISVRQMLSDLLARVIVQLDDGAHIDDERHNKLMIEEKMIVLSHCEWERLIALQENPPCAPEKLTQLMQRKPLIG